MASKRSGREILWWSLLSAGLIVAVVSVILIGAGIASAGLWWTVVSMACLIVAAAISIVFERRRAQ